LPALAFARQSPLDPIRDRRGAEIGAPAAPHARTERRHGNIIGMCAVRLRAQSGKAGAEMDANAVGFAVALPLFLVIAVGIALWVHRMRG
jgi:hypothetical protein